MASSCIPCPKGFGPCALPRASLDCGTLIIADKRKKKTPPTSNGVICFAALAQKWQQKTPCSTEFDYSAANLLELDPSATGNAAPLGTCVYMHVARSHALLGLCVCAWIYCMRICTNAPVDCKRQDQAAAPGTALVKTCILNKFCQITLAHT